MEKLLLALLATPDVRALMVRKTQTSMTSTTLVTWRTKVAKEAIHARVCYFFGGNKEEAAQYRFANGSTLTLGGLDKASKIMSSDYDLIYVGEATELTFDDWQACTTRLRNGTLSFQQLLADCNPDVPTHWLNEACRDGTVKMLQSYHRDNPLYFDEDGKITPVGDAYINGILGNLRGVMRLRLLDGVWAAAEGMIYEDWNPATHLVNRDEIAPGYEGVRCASGVPWEWPRYWSIDWGYTNPFCLQRWAADPDGRLLLYAEQYHTKKLVDDHVADLQQQVQRPGRKEDGQAGQMVWREPRPQFIVADPADAEARAQFEKTFGYPTKAANKSVKAGIQAGQKRMRVEDDGKPRVQIVRDAVYQVDKSLRERKLPTCTAEEIPGYVWDKAKEAPVKENDHGMDAKRYLEMELDKGKQRLVQVMK